MDGQESGLLPGLGISMTINKEGPVFHQAVSGAIRPPHATATVSGIALFSQACPSDTGPPRTTRLAMAHSGCYLLRVMSTLAEIEAAIKTLPASEVEKLAVLLEKRRSKKPSWPVQPPNVDRAELERIEAEIEEEFPTLRK